MNDKWEKWIPKEGLASKYYIDSVEYNESHGLEIKMLSEEDDRKLALCWDGFIVSYMCSDEGGRYKLWENVELTEWTFFKVEESGYKKWIYNQSCGIYEYEDLYHFSILGNNLVVDVIATYEPIIKNYAE